MAFETASIEQIDITARTFLCAIKHNQWLIRFFFRQSGEVATRRILSFLGKVN
jgi:hypothetical protein